MYIIIVGAGDIGEPLIDIATQSQNDVVVIENDEPRAETIATEYDCLVLNNDATELETLDEASAERADALITTTQHDATNVMVSLLANELDIPSVVSVVHNPEHMRLFEQLDVNVMQNPQQLIAEHLYRAVERPTIKDYMQVGTHAEVFEITVTDQSPIAGRTLAAAAADGMFEDGILVVAIERDDAIITPQGATELKPGDLVTVFSEQGATPDVTDVFGHYEDH